MSVKLFFEAVFKFILGVALVGALIFLPAGTLNYWKAWLLMGILFVPMFAAGLVMMVKNPELLKKRLNAKEKTYRYRIWNSDKPCVFQRRFVAVMPEKLDLSAMADGAAYLIGEHDFSAFCGNAKMKKSTVRYIRSIDIRREGEELHLIVTGNGFLHNMVRILVGTLVEVGRGDRSADSIPLLFGGKRADAGFLAPPQGLCLMEVDY